MSSSISSKKMSERDYAQTLQLAFNDNEKVLSVDGFLSSKVGHKLVIYSPSTTVDEFRFLDVVQSQTCTTVNLSPTLTVADSSVLMAGMYVFGAGIPANTVINSIDSPTQVTLSNNATAGASVSIKFANLLNNLQVTYDDAAHTNVLDVERIA